MGQQADIDELIKNNAKTIAESKLSSIQSPTTYSHVYLRVQPFIATYSQVSSTSETTTESSTQQLQFLIYLADPEHQLIHTTVTQAVPGKWLSMWDKYDWVEDLVAEALRVGVEVVGQEYVVARMGWGQEKGTKGVETEEDSGKEQIEDRDKEES